MYISFIYLYIAYIQTVVMQAMPRIERLRNTCASAFFVQQSSNPNFPSFSWFRVEGFGFWV